MKKASRIPVYDICALQKEAQRRKDDHDILVESFEPYLKRHPNLAVPHRHSFYHIVLFTAGSGRHTIDFEQFTVRPGQIYFMIPGQVHSWQFRGRMEGYIINFSGAFLDAFLRQESYAEQFPFLEGVAAQSVIQLSKAGASEATLLMQRMLREEQEQQAFFRDQIRSCLISLFILAQRSQGTSAPGPSKGRHLTLQQFRKLVEQHYTTMRLPKDYAAQLYITPNHLNALCRELLGKPAGEVIRDRVLLEAKRLLVNAELSISEIAWQLRFADNSYFTKFFRKLTGITPEAFRKSLAES